MCQFCSSIECCSALCSGLSGNMLSWDQGSRTARLCTPGHEPASGPDACFSLPGAKAAHRSLGMQ